MAARTFVVLARQLLGLGFDPFAPGARDDLLRSELVAALLVERPWRNDDEVDSLLATLKVLLVNEELSRAQREPEVVATFPKHVRTNVRRTGPVVRELVERAVKEVMVVGYALSDELFVADLGKASARGVEVVIVVDRAQGSLPALIGLWPSGVPLPRCYTNVPASSGSALASMHSKLLVIDGAEALVTSANFTWLGHHENIELGIRIRGATAVASREFFMRLLATGVLVEAPTS